MGMKIRQWRVQDGKEVGRPMDAGSPICDLAITQDGKWIVCGTQSGQAIVWDLTSHEKVIEIKAHDKSVNALDVSVDGTKITTGSIGSALVWSSLTGQKLLGPLKYDIDYWVVAVKFSPNGRRIATATWGHESVRIYDSSDGGLHADFPIRVLERIPRLGKRFQPPLCLVKR
jgi:WD40 repeat protein